MIKIIIFIGFSLLLTIVFEMVPQLFFKKPYQWIKAGIVCNIITNPPLNAFLLLLYMVFPETKIIFAITLILEAAIVFIEAKLYDLMLNKGFLSCLKISVICNLISFISGLIMENIIT